jgi:sugar/nucleoside kinase (ribokinase family)
MMTSLIFTELKTQFNEVKCYHLFHSCRLVRHIFNWIFDSYVGTALSIVVAGHITVDTIISPDFETQSPGGPPCYCGLTARNLGAGVTLVTRFGYDFPDEYALWIGRRGLDINPAFRSLTKPTTRFKITLVQGVKKLNLIAKCEDLDTGQLSNCNGVGIIISPVAGEISNEFVKECQRKFEYTYLDPQGFIRSFEHNGEVIFTQMNSELLQGIDFLKMDEDEAYKVTNEKDPLNSLKILRHLGVKNGIYTGVSGNILLHTSDFVYQIPIEAVNNVTDPTGVGDIFGAAFLATFVKDRDIVWSACMASAASSLALHGRALSKIPEREGIVELAQSLNRRVTKIPGI